MKLQKNSRWCPVSLLIDRSLILLFTSFHINCQRMFQRTLPNDLNKFVFFLPQESHSQVATYALPWVCLGPPNKINPCGSWWRSKINPSGIVGLFGAETINRLWRQIQSPDTERVHTIVMHIESKYFFSTNNFF